MIDWNHKVIRASGKGDLEADKITHSLLTEKMANGFEMS